MSKARYVNGFLINKIDRTVSVIIKQKPEWQAGKFNGIGGKIETGETPRQTMVREFKEETGYYVEPHCWRPLCSLQGHQVSLEDTADGFIVYFFFAITEAPLSGLLQSMTEEIVCIKSLDDKDWLSDAIPNLSWLIPMALSMPNERADSFDIVERY